MSRKKGFPEPLARLSRRERQIMDIVYAQGSATSHEVRDALPDPPSYSAVRALMRILVEKDVLKFRRVGSRYLFEPVMDAGRVRRSALLRLTKSLFGNSALTLVATLLDADELSISAAELKELKSLIADKEAERSEK